MNALSGVSTHSMEPPKFGAEQDYVVVGQQPWLDGIVSGPGVVRQVSNWNFFISRELSENLNSLLRLISALDIPLKNKLLGKLKLAAFNLIFSPVAQELRGTFFWEEGKSTVLHPRPSSDWRVANLCWNGDYSSSWFFRFIQSHKCDKVPKLQHWFQGRSGLCLIIDVEFPPPPPLRHFTSSRTRRRIYHFLLGRFSHSHVDPSLVLPLEGKCNGLAVSQSFSSLISWTECRKYTVTQTRPGYVQICVLL